MFVATTALELWSIFRREVLPKDINLIQLKKIRQVFYSGMIALNKCISELSTLPDANEKMHTLHLELQEAAMRIIREQM